MYVCIYVCMYVYLYVRVCMYVCMCVCIHVCNSCMYVCMYVSMRDFEHFVIDVHTVLYVCIYSCMQYDCIMQVVFTCVGVWMYVPKHTHTYTNTHTYTFTHTYTVLRFASDVFTETILRFAETIRSNFARRQTAGMQVTWQRDGGGGRCEDHRPFAAFFIAVRLRVCIGREGRERARLRGGRR